MTLSPCRSDNFLSAKNVSLNMFFVHADFNNIHRLVHGSHMLLLAMKARALADVNLGPV